MTHFLIAAISLFSISTAAEVVYNGPHYAAVDDRGSVVSVIRCNDEEIQTLLDRTAEITRPMYANRSREEIKEIYLKIYGCRRGASDSARSAMGSALIDLAVAYSFKE